MKKPTNLMDKVQGQDLTKTRKLPKMEWECEVSNFHTIHNENTLRMPEQNQFKEFVHISYRSHF